MNSTHRLQVSLDDAALSDNIVCVHLSTASFLRANVPTNEVGIPRGMNAFGGWAFYHREDFPTSLPPPCLGVPVMHALDAKGRTAGHAFGIVEWTFRVEFARSVTPEAEGDVCFDLGIRVTQSDHVGNHFARICVARSWADATPFEVRDRLARDPRIARALVRVNLAPTVALWASAESL